jgi:hypothetical protein
LSEICNQIDGGLAGIGLGSRVSAGIGLSVEVHASGTARGFGRSDRGLVLSESGCGEKDYEESGFHVFSPAGTAPPR